MPSSLPPGILLLGAGLEHTLRSINLKANKTCNELFYREGDSSFVVLSDSHLSVASMESFEIWARSFHQCRLGLACWLLLHVCSAEKPLQHL